MFTSNDIIVRSGDPGGRLFMQLFNSVSVNPISPPLSFNLYHMQTVLKAFSLEHEPHIIVDTWAKPGGAMDSRTFFNLAGQSCAGNTPKAGRFINAL